MENSHEYRRSRAEERRGEHPSPSTAPAPAPAPAPAQPSPALAIDLRVRVRVRLYMIIWLILYMLSTTYVPTSYRVIKLYIRVIEPASHNKFSSQNWGPVFCCCSNRSRHEVSDPQHQPRISQNSDGIPCSCWSSGERMADVLPRIRAELPCERISFPLQLQRANSDNSPSQPERVRWLHWQRLDFR